MSQLDGVVAYSEASGLHVLDFSTGSDRTIHSVEPGTAIQNLTWAPDGASLVFHTYEFGQHTQFIRQWKMYTIDRNGSEHSLMFDRSGPEQFPAYSPDGRLAYWGNAGLHIDGWTVYTSAGSIPQSAPAWAPDGNAIVFATGNDLKWVSLEDTSDTRMILADVESRSTILEPDVSPDGAQIVFVREVSATAHELWLIETDGTNERVLTRGYLDRHPVWSREGDVIIFVRDGAGIFQIGTGQEDQAQLLVDRQIDHIDWAW